MIYLGLPFQKRMEIAQAYCAKHGIGHVVLLSPEQFQFKITVDRIRAVDWPEIIMYRTYYPLLQEIDKNTLVIVNECLRTQNRYDLTYNCIRHFLNQAGHVLVFQTLPQIDTREDFMVLFDFVTQSKWKRKKYDINLILDNAEVSVSTPNIALSRTEVSTSTKTKEKYAKEREKRFANLGTKDPHTIPRNLYLIGGADKKIYVEGDDRTFAARNGRLKHNRILPFKNGKWPNQPIGILELPHRFIDFSDFISSRWQFTFNVLTADIPVDQWYVQRFTDWSKRVGETATDLQQ